MKKKKAKHKNIIVIDDVIVSEELADEFFACDISKCKGACCVEGDFGAPLELEERAIVHKLYDIVEPYLTKRGKAAIAEQGSYVYDITGEFSTPLVEGSGECAYTIFDENGVALCAFEKAWMEGKSDFQKPVSCHLYPVRVKEKRKTSLLNYDRWDICGAACNKGLHSGTRVYEFVKDALIRKFGEEFYEQLDFLVKSKLEEEEEN